jgi:A nuclease family of the HNH/ENDO VII superfamily with conserved AHH
MTLKTTPFKRLILFCIAITLSSCEKDLYKETIQEQNLQKTEGSIDYVTINDVPFLKPSVQNFKANNLSAAKSSKNKDSELDLELDRIIEYKGKNGFKSYSIPVKSESIESNDYYYENLHVIKDGKKYETFIVRYNPTDDSKDFDFKKFTGKMEFFDSKKKLKKTVPFENGTMRLAPQQPSTGEEGIGGGGGDPCSCDNGPSILGQFFDWVGKVLGNINISLASGNGSNTGYVLTVTPPNIGTSSNTVGNSQSYGGGTIVFVPNEPKWIYPTSQSMMAIRMVQRIGTTDPIVYSWLSDTKNLQIVTGLYFTLYEENTEETKAFARDMINSLIEISTENETANLLELYKVTSYAHYNGYFYKKLDNDFFIPTDIDSSVNFTDPHTALTFARLFLAHCTVLKAENPKWSKTKVFAQAYLDTVQVMLDIVGLVPVYGEIADLANGTIYTIKGDGLNASLSFASTIPIAGWFASGVKFAKRADGLRFLVVGTNNFIHFGAYNSAKFRKALGLAVGDASKQAHHIIARASKILEHRAIQKAAKATTNQGFHIDDALNGIAVATWRNQPNHNKYNAEILKKLEAIPANLSANDTYIEVQNLIARIRTAIVNNPNTHLNDLIF